MASSLAGPFQILGSGRKQSRTSAGVIGHEGYCSFH